MVAPALIYSNHELSTAIDSTHAFEGPENYLKSGSMNPKNYHQSI